MMLATDSLLPQISHIFIGLFLILLCASFIGIRLKNRKGNTATIANLNARIYAWWLMSIVLLLAFFFGKFGTIVLFYLISFAALREFMTLVYRRRADYYSMLCCFYLLLPIQYYFVFSEWYGMFSIFIPVYGFLFLPTPNGRQSSASSASRTSPPYFFCNWKASIPIATSSY